jgi:hypothetical protein
MGPPQVQEVEYDGKYLGKQGTGILESLDVSS